MPERRKDRRPRPFLRLRPDKSTMNIEAQKTTVRPAGPPPLRIAWLVWAMGAPLYVIGFFHRVAPAVMTAELMRDFAIDAASLGNLSAFYFYSYVLMQIPTGILADRWGPRRLLSTGALVAGIGGTVFALAPGIGLAYLGRFLIGGSVAVAWIGLLKVTANWFAPQLFSMVTGVGLICGIFGAVGAGPPLRLLMDHASWRPAMLAVSAATLAIGILTWWLVRDSPHEKGYADFSDAFTGSGDPSVLQDLGRVLHYRNTWLLFAIPGGVAGPVLTFGGLWGVPFLTAHYPISTSRASMLTSLLLAAWAASSPIFGWLSDHLGRRKPLYLASGSVALAGWCAIIHLPGLPLPAMVGLMIVTGMASGCMIVSFAFARESVPAGVSGTATGIVNMGIMLGPMILQPAVGLLLDRFWSGDLADGVRLYEPAGYQAGFSLMLAWLALSMVLLVFTRETYRHQQA